VKTVASDKIEIVFITTAFAIIGLTMSYRGLITLKLIIKISLNLDLIAELYESRLSLFILRAERRIIREKNYRYRFSRLSSSLWYILIKSDSLRNLRDSDIDINIYIFLELFSQLSHNRLNFNDSVSIKIIYYY